MVVLVIFLVVKVQHALLSCAYGTERALHVVVKGVPLLDELGFQGDTQYGLVDLLGDTLEGHVQGFPVSTSAYTCELMHTEFLHM